LIGRLVFGKRAARKVNSRAGLAITSLLLFFIALSCGSGNSDRPDAVARVYDQYLDWDEVEPNIPDELRGLDSVRFVQNFAEDWIKKQLIFKKAQDNLSADDFNIDQQLEEYKRSLYSYEFEQQIINQNLDTTVTPEQIENYYKTHPGDFELKDNIIKVVYVKLKKDAPKLNLVKNWYRSESAKDKMSLEDYCHQYAENFFLNDDSWLMFDDLLKEIPIQTYDQESYLRNNRFVELNDGNYIYLVNIKGFKIKEGISPLSFERENIKKILLNQRKLKLVDELHTSLYEKAAGEKDFEIFVKEPGK
jgi:hypothetical protein